ADRRWRPRFRWRRRRARSRRWSPTRSLALALDRPPHGELELLLIRQLVEPLFPTPPVGGCEVKPEAVADRNVRVVTAAVPAANLGWPPPRIARPAVGRGRALAGRAVDPVMAECDCGGFRAEELVAQGVDLALQVFDEELQLVEPLARRIGAHREPPSGPSCSSRLRVSARARYSSSSRAASCSWPASRCRYLSVM